MLAPEATIGILYNLRRLSRWTEFTLRQSRHNSLLRVIERVNLIM